MNLMDCDRHLRPHVPRRSLSFDRGRLRTLFSIDDSDIEDSVRRWYQLLPRFKSPKLISYEELVEAWPGEAPFIKVLDEENYLNYFCNPGEILSWFEDFRRTLDDLTLPAQKLSPLGTSEGHHVEEVP